MRAFKCALRVMRAHLIFPIVYIIGLSFMGIFMAMSFNFGQADEQFQPERGDFAVVDRDTSAVSAGISEALSAKGGRIEVADDRQAFQDAVAKGSVDYLLVVPEGYGDAFTTAAREGAEPPSLDVVFSYYSAEGAYLDEAVGSYLSAVRTIAAAHPEATLNKVANDALEAIGHTAHTTILETGSSMTEVDRFLFYLQWSTYTLFAGITVCIGVLTAAMGRTDVRRRSLISPLSFVSYNVQLHHRIRMALVVRHRSGNLPSSSGEHDHIGHHMVRPEHVRVLPHPAGGRVLTRAIRRFHHHVERHREHLRHGGVVPGRGMDAARPHVAYGAARSAMHAGVLVQQGVRSGGASERHAYLGCDRAHPAERGSAAPIHRGAVGHSALGGALTHANLHRWRQRCRANSHLMTDGGT